MEELIAQCDASQPLSAEAAGFTVSLSDAGTKTIGFIRCDQPQVLDIEFRNGRKLERVLLEILEEVLSKLAPLFN